MTNKTKLPNYTPIESMFLSWFGVKAFVLQHIANVLIPVVKDGKPCFDFSWVRQIYAFTPDTSKAAMLILLLDVSDSLREDIRNLDTSKTMSENNLLLEDRLHHYLGIKPSSSKDVVFNYAIFENKETVGQ